MVRSIRLTVTPKQRLIQLHLENNRLKHPNFPDQYRPKGKYDTKTANGLTRAIVDFLNFSGHQAERISSTGRWIENKGKGHYIPGSSTKGTADISATIRGKSVKIEVKIGRDRQSEVQKEYQAKIERAGGVYIIAKTIDQFMEWYDSFILTLTKP